LTVLNTNNNPAELRKLYHRHTIYFLYSKFFATNYFTVKLYTNIFIIPAFILAVDNPSQFE